MTITEFLEARIAEDEAAARAATPSPWTLYDRGVGWEIPELPEVHDGLTFSKSDAHYVARNQPGRALAECAAKRAIIGLHTSETWSVPGPPPGDPHTYITESDNPNEVRVKRGGTFVGKISRAEFFERMGATKNPPAKELRALAAVYSSHPDYDEEWAL
jgi:hypothetical protein